MKKPFPYDLPYDEWYSEFLSEHRDAIEKKLENGYNNCADYVSHTVFGNTFFEPWFYLTCALILYGLGNDSLSYFKNDTFFPIALTKFVFTIMEFAFFIGGIVLYNKQKKFIKTRVFFSAYYCDIIREYVRDCYKKDRDQIIRAMDNSCYTTEQENENLLRMKDALSSCIRYYERCQENITGANFSLPAGLTWKDML